MQIYQGLNAEQVQESRRQHGENTMTPPERIPAWKLFLQKFNDPIIKLLLFATLLSFITGYFHGSFAESFGILIAVFLATFLSFINEYRAAREFDVLNQINDSVLVKVYREGHVVMIPKTEIVVGDYVIVEQGDEIPADGVVVEVMSLSVNESTLNGESVPAEKKPGEVADFEGAYAPNRIYRGTTVAEGSGVMEVFAVGDATEIGKTARQATELTGQETPLNRQLDKLSGIISKISFIVAGSTFLALCVLDFVVQGKTFDWSMQTFELLLSFFMIAVTLIVVAVPEGLAMSVTLSLAYSMRKMTASNTLVRKMHACETMGATTVICTDKTGTLTQNRMRVKEAVFANGVDNHIAEAFASNSSAFLDLRDPKNIQEVGNPTECALLMCLHDKGYDYVQLREGAKLVQRLVFSTERKYMATLVDSQFDQAGPLKLYLKGAPEIVLKLVKDIDIQATLSEIAVFQNKGMRALGFLVASIDRASAETPIEDLIAGATFDNVTIYANVKGDGKTAGFTSYMPNGKLTITECKVYGSVSGNPAAGFVTMANNGSSEIEITYSENHAAVTAKNLSAGGFYSTHADVGSTRVCHLTIKGCANYGAITASDWRVGGIVGEFNEELDIQM